MTKFCSGATGVTWKGPAAGPQYRFTRQPDTPDRGSRPLRHHPTALIWTAGLALCAAATGCTKSTQGAAPPGRTGRTIAVKVEPVNARDVTYKIQAVGSLEAEEVVQVTAEVEGVVTDVRFNEGMRVGPQTVLFRIDPDRYRLQAEQ